MSESRDERTAPHVDEPSAPAQTAPQARSGGFGTALLGGLIGAALVGGGGYFWLARNQQPAQLAERITAVEGTTARLDTLAGEIGSVRNEAAAAAEAARSEAAAGVQSVQDAATAQRSRFDAAVADIGAAQSRLGRVEQTTADLPARTGATEQRLTQIQGAVEASRAASESALTELRARIANIDSLGQRMASVEEHLAGLDRSAEQAAALGQRVAAVEAALRSETAALSEKMAAVGAGVAAGAGLGAALEGLKSTTDQDRAALAQTQAAIETLGGTLATEIEATRLATGTELQALAERLSAEAAGRERLLAMSLDAMRIASSVERGEPFVDEVEDLRRLAGDDATVGAVADRLQPLADGVPTIAALLEQLPPPPTQPPMEQAQPGGLLGQAGQALTGLVTVAPEGAAVGPAAQRLEGARDALQRQDLDAAIGEVQAVAGTGLAGADPWLDAARRRQTALAALEELDAHVEALATSRS